MYVMSSLPLAVIISTILIVFYVLNLYHNHNSSVVTVGIIYTITETEVTPMIVKVGMCDST